MRFCLSTGTIIDFTGLKKYRLLFEEYLATFPVELALPSQAG